MKPTVQLIVVVVAAVAVMGAKRSCTCHCSTASIDKVVIAGDIDRKEVEAKDVRSTFKPDQKKIFCVVGFKYAPKGTNIEVIWKYKGGPSGTVPAREIIRKKKEVNGTGRWAISMVQPTREGWPEGKYEVEVVLNGKTDRKVEFEVKK